MGRLAMATFAIVLLFLALSPLTTSAQFTSTSLTLNVYADGSAAITQILSANSSDVSMRVELLSSVLTDVVAVDQSGSPLSFQLSGTNITIYTLGSTGVTLRYDTDALTDKQGTVWTLDFSTAYNSTVVLPQGSMVTLVSGTPDSFSEQEGSPVVAVPPGSWQISYGVPVSIPTSTSSTSLASSGSQSISQTLSTGPANSGTSTQASTSSRSVASPSSQPYIELALAAMSAVVVAIIAFVLLRRRGSPDLTNTDLRPDDIQVLNYITEKGGKVFEPEIRTRFVLPKTSAWRQIKRLERLGYVKITKVGSQNQIEVIKNRGKQDA